MLTIFRTTARHLLLIVSMLPVVQLAAAQGNDALNGIWLIENEIHTLRTIDGDLPPMLPESQAIYEEHKKQRANGDVYFDRATWCAAVGLPRLLLEDHPFEIMVDRHQVGFFFEWNRWVRLVDMSGAELELYYPLSMGVPSGHWDGDTLVIETVGIMKENIMDHAGIPHSDELVMTERLRLLDENTLENHIRFEDPLTFSRPWETVITYTRQPGAMLQEDVCLDRIKQGQPAI